MWQATLLPHVGLSHPSLSSSPATERWISAVSVGCENIPKINEKKLTETDLYILGLLEIIKAQGQQIEELKVINENSD